MITAVEIGGGGEWMHLCCGQFWLPWQCADAIRSASPMQHDQGFTGSHRTPPLGDYSLRIALAAARAIINTTIMQHIPTFLAVLMAITMQQYYTMCIARWRKFVTKRHHQVGFDPLLPNQTHQSCCFGHFIMKKSSSANAIVSDIS